MNNENYSKNLGKKTEYSASYDSSLLDPIPRDLGRSKIKGFSSSGLVGKDIWTAYELSWLNEKGKPVVRIADFFIPFDSKNLIESKSLKLYLNSFNNNKFCSDEEVRDTILRDLSESSVSNVEVVMRTVDQSEIVKVDEEYKNIDDIDIEVDGFEYDPDFLKQSISGEIVSEALSSHLLKSNCLVTNQPDWASLFIRYRGPKIDHEHLLRYVVSFRDHNEFHEQCVERIYTDIKRCCLPEQLTVFARYTRRGGLDINPYRSDCEPVNIGSRNPRQ